MNPRDSPSPRRKSDADRPVAVEIQPSSPRYPLTPKSSDGSHASDGNRRIAIAVDLSDESAFAVQWAVQNYLRPGDVVTILHVRPTSILYGADWGSTHFSVALGASDQGDESAAAAAEEEKSKEASRRKIEEDFDKLTAGKIADLAQPLVDSKIPFKVHIVKDHDMKERLCLEIERLNLSAVIMGSRGFGASRRTAKGRLGSVSDYCVHHCICPVVVVRFPGDKDGDGDEDEEVAAGGSLHPVPEEEPEYHDAAAEHDSAAAVVHEHKD